MASIRGKSQPSVGSARWVYDEREVAQQFIEQEVEEFTFSAQTEMEWLNEHMVDIFSHNEFNITEAFKTPGKLRGKTPRTARKLQQSAARAPLTDIFSSNNQLSPSPAAKLRLNKPAPRTQVREDKENALPQQTSPNPKVNAVLSTIDSGFFDTVRSTVSSPKAPVIPPKSPLRSPLSRHHAPPQSEQIVHEKRDGVEEAKDSEESFVSADEAPSDKIVNSTEIQKKDGLAKDTFASSTLSQQNEQSTARIPSNPFSVSAKTDADMQEVADHVERTSPARGQEVNEMPPPSNVSVEQSVVQEQRRDNVTPAPPRKLVTIQQEIEIEAPHVPFHHTQQSLTTHNSFPDHGEQIHDQGMTQNSPKAHEVDDKSVSHPQQTLEENPKSESIAFHNKTSTQRLHERITMLGKSNPPRASRSISTSLANVHAPLRKPDQFERTKTSSAAFGAGDDDWIAPVPKETRALNRQTAEESNGQKQDQPQVSTSYPNLPVSTAESTTPVGSPYRWNADGPLSASKAKFQSFLRSAKGMFASSAATSAQAKMEAMAHSPTRNAAARQTGQGEILQPLADVPELTSEPASQPTENISRSSIGRKRSASAGPLQDLTEISDEQPPTKRRSSKRISEARARQASQDHEHGGADGAPELDTKSGLPDEVEKDRAQALEAIEPSHQSIKKPLRPMDGQLKAAGTQRPKQIARPNTGSKAKPGQISVMVPSMRPQLGAGGNSIKAQGHHLNTSQTSAARPPLTKKASDSSMRSASSQSVRTTQANSKLKALESAKRKKEQDEREQQRKEEQKRALEKRRAEKAEEERLAHERKLADQKREADARAAAQKRAAELQKAEKQQREDQLRAQAEAAKPKPVNDHASKSQNERFYPITKTEKVPVRPEPRAQEGIRPQVPHINPAKPAKRYFNPDADEQAHGASDMPKKAKMSEEFELRTQAQPLARAPIGAPMRPSMAKKQELPAKFQHGFMSGVGSTRPSSSMLKNAISTSQQLQGHPKTPHTMNDMAKFANARIPFAEAPNPPGPAQPAGNGQAPRTVQKTPATASHAAKSSPAFPNGDNISLPDIATDSEDEDSDDAFEAPAWTDSPELRRLLEQQQLVDPMRVFGPIAPLSMEEVFKGASKDRMKRFRDRTSSANWNGPDRLTEEERRRDREARERLEKDGGWTYETNMEIEKNEKHERLH
ncbi:MAG: hypothetical protein Q9162_003225 [Coniocarpon cinnabarinum]